MKQRILMFIQYLGINPATFEKKVKLSNGFVNNIGASVRENTIAKISAVFPELNINWWKTGEGNMLNNEIETDSVFLKNQKGNFLIINNNDYIKILKMQEDSISLQKKFDERLKIAQDQLTESQRQISLLIEILKKN